MWCSMNCHVDVLTLHQVYREQGVFGGNARMIRGGHRFSMEIGHWATTLVKKATYMPFSESNFYVSF